MSVEVTRLPAGLLVVTDRMPHLETASLGVWIGSGSRNEKPDAPDGSYAHWHKTTPSCQAMWRCCGLVMLLSPE